MSTQSVNTLVSSILSYVADNKQATNNIQQQVAALLGASLPSVIMDMGKGMQLDAVCKTLEAVKPDIVAVLSGIVDKAPAVSIRNTAVSDLVKRINRAFAGEATKQADIKAQTSPSGDVHYVSMTRNIKDKTVSIDWKEEVLTYSQQIGKDGKIKPAAKVVKEVKDKSPVVSTVHEPVNMQELVAAVRTQCGLLNIEPVDFALAFELAIHVPASKATGKGKLPASLKTQAV